MFDSQLNQALAGKFNAHVHVEYEWCLQHEDLDESDEDLDEKVKEGEGLKKLVYCQENGCLRTIVSQLNQYKKCSII